MLTLEETNYYFNSLIVLYDLPQLTKKYIYTYYKLGRFPYSFEYKLNEFLEGINKTNKNAEPLSNLNLHPNSQKYILQVFQLNSYCLKRLSTFLSFKNKTLLKAIDLYSNNPDLCHQYYGHISKWNVSNVTDMEGLFALCDFNENISEWDVSNVTNMSHMFETTDYFNQPLENWDVSNVTNMSDMFVCAAVFNQPLEKWDVSNVKNMFGMFSCAFEFNQSLNNWNISNDTEVDYMFAGSSQYNQPLDKWNTDIKKRAFYDV